MSVPDRGDLVWLRFELQAGRETQKTRPALVLTPAAYNGKTRLCIACPITSQVKGYPFEVPLPPGLGVEGAVLADQVKSLDWQARDARVIAQAPDDVLGAVLGRVAVLLGV